MTKSTRRNEIQLACPHCGKEQSEPGIAISTFCRSCGKHFQIENGIAQPPFGSGDPGPRFRSTVAEGDEAIDYGFDTDHPKDSHEEPEPVAPVAKRSFFGLGRFRQESDDEVPKTALEKKPIRCFECGHIHEVSLAATSTQCARCSLYISLGDENIRGQYSRNIRTRGDVTIYRKGSVVGCEIACHDLTVLGKISGSVDCSGNATFKNSGKVLGSMHCKHIIVDKKCELDFPQGIIAESADIYGVVRGDILCSGTIHIFKTGSVLGDATARAIVMKDGGVLTGQMSIQHDVDISLPEKGTVRPEQPQVLKEEISPPTDDKSDQNRQEQTEKAQVKQDLPEANEQAEKTPAKKSPAKSEKKANKKPASSAKDVRDDDKEDQDPFELSP